MSFVYMQSRLNPEVYEKRVLGIQEVWFWNG